LENWAAALSLAYELKLPVKDLQGATKSFRGVKRRLEVRMAKTGISVIDDFAHSPAKARESIRALKKHFPKSRIFVIFEPNRGGRSVKCLKKYKGVFDGIYKLYIPKLKVYKKKTRVKDLSGRELADNLRTYVRKLESNVFYFANRDKILADILKQVKAGDVVAFLGHGNFDEMIKKIEHGLNRL